MSNPDASKDPRVETDFIRKMVLGILSTLENKGVLSQAEVESIIRAARQAAQTSAEDSASARVVAPRKLENLVPIHPARAPRGPAPGNTVWVKPGQAPAAIDTHSPILPPGQRAVSREVTKASAQASDDSSAVPFIDMELE